jgi:hypothetical protein
MQKNSKAMGVPMGRRETPSTFPVKTTLTCRDCRQTVERVLNLEPGVSASSASYQCSGCAEGKSMLDGQDREHVIKNTKLARSALWRKEGGYLEYRYTRKTANSQRWRRQNADWVKLYALLHRAGFRGDPPFTLEDWYRRVETQFSWQCTGCGTPLTRETVVCNWTAPLSDGASLALENCVPVCRKCSNRHAAIRRWEQEKFEFKGVDAQVNRTLYIDRGNSASAVPADLICPETEQGTHGD